MYVTARRSTDYCLGCYFSISLLPYAVRYNRQGRHFGVICPYPLRHRRVVVGGRGHVLVLAWFESCVLCLVFLDSSLQSPGQEKHFGIPLRVIVREIQLSVQIMPKEKMADLAWFSALFIVFCSSTDILS